MVYSSMKKAADWINKQNIKAFLAVYMALIVSVILIILCFIPIPAANKDLMTMSMGAIIGSGVVTIIGYYFGSSETKSLPKPPDNSPCK